MQCRFRYNNIILTIQTYNAIQINDTMQYFNYLKHGMQNIRYKDAPAHIYRVLIFVQNQSKSTYTINRNIHIIFV